MYSNNRKEIKGQEWDTVFNKKRAREREEPAKATYIDYVIEWRLRWMLLSNVYPLRN